MTHPNDKGDPQDKWVTQLRKGSLELCVLTIIAGEPRYGYEIAKELGTVHGPSVSEGTVYPILSRLKRDGLLDSRIEESSSGPPRKYYGLTAAGRQRLEAMNDAWDRLHTRILRLRRRNRS